MRKFLEWLEYPGALADSYHSIITQDCMIMRIMAVHTIRTI